jgi:hypothetical protein
MVKQEEILSRLIKIVREFSRARRVDPDSQFCSIWEDPTVEILVGSDELNAIETEFGIEFDEDSAMEIFEMTLLEASKFIKNLIQAQKKNTHNPEKVIQEMSPERAKRILLEVWRESGKGRNYISAAIDKIDFEDRNKGKKINSVISKT